MINITEYESIHEFQDKICKTLNAEYFLYAWWQFFLFRMIAHTYRAVYRRNIGSGSDKIVSKCSDNNKNFLDKILFLMPILG